MTDSPRLQAPMLEGAVEQLLPGGEALVRTDQGVVLVANGVPGDVLALEPRGRRRGAERARIRGCIEASKLRVPAPCPAAQDCGGCALQYVNVSAHSDIKSDWVSNVLGKYLDAQGEFLPVQEKPEFGMRRRARWHTGQDTDGGLLGFHSRRSHRVVRASSCAVAHPDMDALRLAIEDMLPTMVESVRMLRLHDGMHVVFECGDSPVPDASLFEAVLAAVADAPLTMQPWLRAGPVIRPLTRPVQELHDRLPAGDAWVDLAVGPEDFVQGHAAGNEAILRQIQAWAGSPRRIADLFCGIGNLSLPMAAACGAQVVGADVAESSIRAARANARRLGIQAEFEALNLFEGVGLKHNAGEHYVGADVLLLDPPRKGAKAICRDMGRLLPEKIIMVNCDIAAGARDAETLQQQGYCMQSLRALDIFPFSGHVEAMSLWTR